MAWLGFLAAGGGLGRRPRPHQHSSRSTGSLTQNSVSEVTSKTYSFYSVSPSFQATCSAICKFYKRCAFALALSGTIIIILSIKPFPKLAFHLFQFLPHCPILFLLFFSQSQPRPHLSDQQTSDQQLSRQLIRINHNHPHLLNSFTRFFFI